MALQKTPLNRIRTIVTAYDRLADDPQAQETLLGLMGGIDAGTVDSYRTVLLDSDTPSRRPIRNPSSRRRVTDVRVMFTVQLAC
ncbi:hypothetical protein P3T35_002471 [Kitasatospora sp. GP30]|uniref:hypothetical protein n=1 Tax=Kitasatospora sp. GP30 TaxID=3035084 RepID=UPI000C6FE849|nr:hypothetical protein [Kitasatospora sp. GP30]MDH6140463.1 hypothetical protein [Kitasatospora sp. GP30]